MHDVVAVALFPAQAVGALYDIALCVVGEGFLQSQRRGDAGQAVYFVVAVSIDAAVRVGQALHQAVQIYFVCRGISLRIRLSGHDIMFIISVGGLRLQRRNFLHKVVHQVVAVGSHKPVGVGDAAHPPRLVVGIALFIALRRSDRKYPVHGVINIGRLPAVAVSVSYGPLQGIVNIPRHDAVAVGLSG